MPTDSSTELEFDDEWEADAERRLDTVEYDTELGKRIGRDAQRLAAGEISESEFYERHHEDVVAEFGVDNRPVSPDEGKSTAPGGSSGGGDGNGPMPTVPGEDPSRRSVLKTAGVLGAAAVGVSTLEGLTTGVAGEEDNGDTQMGMAIDMSRCIACLQCVEACNEENNNTADALWMFVHRYTEDDYRDTEQYLPRPCQHCSDAPCEAACPVVARYTREDDGIVMTDYDACIGCRYCEVACPYGVNYLQWGEPHDIEEFTEMQEQEHGIEDARINAEGKHTGGNPPKGVMGKCTFCVHRQDSDNEDVQGTTACEQICPEDAIKFGNLEDEESDPRQHIAELDDADHTYRLLEDRGTEPNVIYVGSPPSPDATPVEGPRTLEDMDRDLTRNRRGRDPVEFPYEDGD